MLLFDSGETSSSFSNFKVGLIISAVLASLLALCYAYRAYTTSWTKGDETAYDRWNKQYGVSTAVSYDDTVIHYQANPLASAAHGGGRGKWVTESVDGAPKARGAVTFTANPLHATGHNPLTFEPRHRPHHVDLSSPRQSAAIAPLLPAEPPAQRKTVAEMTFQRASVEPTPKGDSDDFFAEL